MIIKMKKRIQKKKKKKANTLKFVIYFSRIVKD